MSVCFKLVELELVHRMLVGHLCSPWTSRGSPGCSSGCRRSVHRVCSGGGDGRWWTSRCSRSTLCTGCRASSTASGRCPGGRQHAWRVNPHWVASADGRQKLILWIYALQGVTTSRSCSSKVFVKLWLPGSFLPWSPSASSVQCEAAPLCGDHDCSEGCPISCCRLNPCIHTQTHTVELKRA